MTTYRVTSIKPTTSTTEGIANMLNTETNATEPTRTIRNILVTPKGIESSQLDQLCSEKGIKGIYKTAIFSATQSLLYASVKLDKFDKYIARMHVGKLGHKVDEIKTSTRYIDTQVRANSAAQRLAILHSISDSRGLNINLEITPTQGRISNQADIEKKAKFARMTVDQVMKLEQASAEKAFNDAQDAAATAEMLFYSAEIENHCEEVDEDGEVSEYCEPILTYFHPQACLKDLMRTRNWLVTRSYPDYTEIGLLANDIDTLETACQRFEEMTEQGNEESRDFDDKAASSADLTQGSADHDQ